MKFSVLRKKFPFPSFGANGLRLFDFPMIFRMNDVIVHQVVKYINNSIPLVIK